MVSKVLRIGLNIHGLSAGRLRPSAPKVKRSPEFFWSAALMINVDNWSFKETLITLIGFYLVLHGSFQAVVSIACNLLLLL